MDKTKRQLSGRMFQRIRMALGLTTAKLAPLLEVSPVYLRSLESRPQPVPQLMSYKLMNLLQERLVSDDPLFVLLRQLLSQQNAQVPPAPALRLPPTPPSAQVEKPWPYDDDDDQQR